MQLSKLVIEKLKTTTDLRLRVALALGIEEISLSVLWREEVKHLMISEPLM
ncbi:MAG: hypothetical protein IPQ27_13185 [Chitinophagaceae bacterium]|nr:hypothetical protein [Chitinophagaceae bacterium]